MGLRCSLFGHTFGETDARRDREARGDEVVTVVKTIERCTTCGAERVVSENKEVVSVVDAEELDEEEMLEEAAAAESAAKETETDPEHEPTTDDGDVTAEATGDAGSPEAGAAGADADESPAESLGAEADAGGESDGSDEHGGELTAEAPDLDPEADPEQEEEDVEFITETDGTLGGGDEVDVDVDEEAPGGGIGGMAARSGAYGDQDEEPEAETPETAEGATEEDAEILGEESSSGERAPGQWPDDPTAEDEPWEPGDLGEEQGTEPEPEPDVSEPAPVEPAPASGPEPETLAEALRCPTCGHTVPVSGSYRAGDACPECQRDYLEAAEDE